MISQEIRKEFESIEKQWAKRLEEKENEIENLKNKTRFLNSMAPEEKGVSAWKEIEVVQWINYNLPVSYSSVDCRSVLFRFAIDLFDGRCLF